MTLWIINCIRRIAKQMRPCEMSSESSLFVFATASAEKVERVPNRVPTMTTPSLVV